MKNDLPVLSKEQLKFIAVLDALGRECSIEVVGIMAPLLPGPMLDLLDKAETGGWMKRTDDNRLILSRDLPSSLQAKLDKMSTGSHLNELVDAVTKNDLSEKIDPAALVQLYQATGRTKEASQAEIILAQQSMAKGANETAKRCFQQALDRIFERDDHDSERLFIDGTLQFSNICFFLGQGMIDIPKYLHRAHELSEKLGDRRSHGMINLHFGRLFYFTGMRDKALVAFSVGYEGIRDLGDEDILTQAAAFLGIYFFMQGRFSEALSYFKKVETLYQQDQPTIPPLSLTPIFLGYCNIYLGRFHRALGSLDFYLRLAREQSDWPLATTIKTVLGTVLVLIGNNSEGYHHLEEAEREARQQDNTLALYFAGGGIALYYYRKGDIRKAYEESKKVAELGAQSGLIQQLASPWILEALYDLHRQGYEPIPQFDYHELLERFHPQQPKQAWKEINIHLQGVVMRLREKEKMDDGLFPESVRNALGESEAYLRQAGDPIQLAKTHLELARWELSAGSRHRARQLAQKAWQELGGYANLFFPDDFRALLGQQTSSPETKNSLEDFQKRYFEMLEILIPAHNPDEGLMQVVRSTNRFFGAERGGLLWFPARKSTRNPELRAACNLTDKHIKAADFKRNFSWIKKAFLSGKPLLIKPTGVDKKPADQPVAAALCLPLAIEGTVVAVLYHDNSYAKDAFSFLNQSLLTTMSHHLSVIVERFLEDSKTKQASPPYLSNKSVHLENVDQQAIVTGSPRVLKLLKQAEQIAAADSTVLICGESGTGKELLADLIHRKSLRAERSLIVIDSTTIPKNLFESELFGHEKGAFTGADQRKIGYIELANNGTLFLDEIGELPLSIQTKLLRTLQEKTFSRVGGTALIKSNFRLISATNRDLQTEVAEGRFRADLYYRLHVVPLNLPPLRDRGEDAFLLARHFIDRFCKKHHRNRMKLSPGDKKQILKYSWPGNIRELMNVMERSVILSSNGQLELNLPSGGVLPISDPFGDKPTLAEVQRRYISYILEHTGGKISGPGGAAGILGLKRSSVYARMNSLGMKR